MARNKFDVDEKLESPFNIAHLKRAFVYIKRQRNKMIPALVLSATGSVAGLFGPKIMQWTIDNAIPEKNLRLLLWLFIAYIGVTLLNVAFNTVRSRLMSLSAQNIIHDIRGDLFAHLQRLPFSYYDSRPAGKILVRIINYVNSVSDMLSNSLVNMILEILNVLFIIGFMFATSPKMALVTVAGLPVFILVIFLIKPRQRRSWQEASNKNSNYNAYLAESIDGVKVTQLFARQEVNIGIVKRLSEACRRTWLKAIYISNCVWFSSEMLTQIVLTALYVVAVYFMGGGKIAEIGLVVAMGNYLSRFWQPITNLANIYNNFVNNIAYLERIFETMDEPVDIADAPDAAALPALRGGVSFQDVTFSYEPGINILEHLNLEVTPGENIALVGPTGAGKTTVVNLISRFYNLNDGAILLDGEYDIGKATLHSLRSQMGIMLQDSFVFAGTIRDNIRYGRLDATDEEIEEAAKAVRAHDFIMQTEKGYDTEVGERGSGLSGGQRQLLTFARTLVSNPKILILDEATSSIDTKTERLLQEGIRNLTAGRTSFIIAHRLSTIKNCDRILYIGNKQILESGSHEELMEKRGYYYQLYTAQARDQGMAV